MLLIAMIFLGSALVFALFVLYGETYGEIYSDSPEILRVRVAKQRRAQNGRRLLGDHG